METVSISSTLGVPQITLEGHLFKKPSIEDITWGHWIRYASIMRMERHDDGRYFKT